MKPKLLEVDGLNNEDKELITKLLELNPEKRMNADDFINSPMFQMCNQMNFAGNRKSKNSQRS